MSGTRSAVAVVAASCATLAGLVVLAVRSVGGASWEHGPLFDDAYIYLAAARTLLETGRLAVSPTHETLAGLTSPAYALLLAGCGRVADLPSVAGWIGMAGALAAPLLCYALVRSIGSDKPGPVSPAAQALPFVAALPLACSGEMAVHAVSGMETVLAVAMLLAGCLALVRWGVGWRSGAIAGLLVLSRPDGLVFPVAVATAAALDRVLPPAGVARRSRGELAAFLVAAGVPFFAQAMTFQHVLGGVTANSVQARILLYCWDATPLVERFGRAAGALAPLIFITPVVGLLAMVGAFVGLTGSAAATRAGFVARVLTLIAGGYLTAFALSGVPPEYHLWRYALPLHAAATALMGIGLHRVRTWWGHWSARRKTLAFCLLAVLAGASAYGETGRWQSNRTAIDTFRWLNDGYRRTLWNLALHATAADRVAVSDVGQALWYLRNPVIDLAGLTQPEIEDVVADRASRRCIPPSARDLSPIVRRLGVRYVVLGAPFWDPFLGTAIPSGAPAALWSVAPARAFRVT